MIFVTSLDDVSDPDDGKLTLREAVSEANGTPGAETITFASDLTGVLRLTEGEITITDSVLINGQGRITISGDRSGDDILSSGVTNVLASRRAGLLDDNSRLFVVDGADAATSLVSLTLTGGHAPTSGGGGGAITSNAEDLTLFATRLTGNSTTGENQSGGAINARELTLRESSLDANFTFGDGSRGGAIYAEDVALDRSDVRGNRTFGDRATGGAIDAQSITATGGSFQNNSTAGGSALGGAIRAQDISLNGSLVTSNRTEGVAAIGGAIHGLDATVINSFFEANSTRGMFANGGAIHAGNLLVIDSTVRQNITQGSGAEGGGISAGTATVIDSVVGLNTTIGANGNGGGIVGLTLTLSNTSVTDNATFGDDADGGGVSAARVTTTNSTIAGNTTSGSDADGAGIFASTALTASNTTIAENAAFGADSSGGGAFVGNATLINSTVVGNLSRLADGGGLNALSATITDSVLLGNVRVFGEANDVSVFGSTSLSGANIIGGNLTRDGVVEQTSIELLDVFLTGEPALNSSTVETIALRRDPSNPALDQSTSTAPDTRGVEPFGLRDLGAFEVGSPIGLTNLNAARLNESEPGDGFRVAHDPALNARDGWTLQAWVAINEVDNEFNRILRLPVDGRQTYSLLIRGDGRAEVRTDPPPGGAQVVTAGPDLRDGLLHHIAATFDPLARQLVLYVDGEEVGRRTTPEGFIPITGTSDLEIGFTEQSETQYLDGAIHGVRVYDRALDATEIFDGSIFPANFEDLQLNIVFPSGSPIDIARNGLGVSTEGAPRPITAFNIGQDETLSPGIQSVFTLPSEARISVRVTATDGTLDVPSVPGVNRSPIGPGDILLGGDQADVNVALAALTWTPNPDFVGASSIEVTIGEGSIVDTASIPVYVRGGALEVPSLVVTTTEDVADDRDGVTSLREAVALANEEAGADTITFAQDIEGTIRLREGALVVTEDLRVEGGGQVTISGDAMGDDILRAGTGLSDALANLAALSAGADRIGDNSTVFVFGDDASPVELDLIGLTLTGGVADDSNVGSGQTSGGGAVRGTGALSLLDTTIDGNIALGDTGANPFGGAVLVFGSVLSVNTTISQNIATGSSATGGGVVVASNLGSGPARVSAFVNTTIADNQAIATGTLPTAEARAGGLFGFALEDALVVNSTITGNVAIGPVAREGGVGGGAFVANSIVSGNQVVGDTTSTPDVDVFSRDQPNLVGLDLWFEGSLFATVAAESVFDQTRDNHGVQAGVLGNNGGPVRTVALKSNLANPVLDLALPVLLNEAELGVDLNVDGDIFDVVATDARGELREVDLRSASFNPVESDVDVEPSQPIIDLGAYEIARTPTGGPDFLVGTDGADTIDAGSGDDLFLSTPGSDQLDGGADDDTVDYSASRAGIDVRLNGSASSGGDAQGDRLFSIENVVGSNFADTITGNGAGNTLDGGGGSDSIIGSGDADLLIGGTGGDEMRGNAGNDTLEGGANNDRLFGDEDEDMLFGGANNDRIFGGGDNDTIEGGDGDDELFGTLGADLIYGGDDDDLIAGNAGADILYGGDGNDTVNGNEFADILYGGANNDTLNAGSGLDALFGGDGEDVLNSGASSDVLTGGGGADTFEFTVTGGIDRITDWQDGTDVLDFTADGLGFGDFAVSTFGGGAGAKIVGGGYVVFFEGIATTDIDATDFL